MAQAFLLTLSGLAAFMGAQPLPRSLESIWHGLVFFFGARLLQSGARLAWMWRSGRLDAAAPGEATRSGEEEGEEEEGGGGGEEVAGNGVAAAERPEGQHQQQQQPRRRHVASPDPSGGQLELAP